MPVPIGPFADAAEAAIVMTSEPVSACPRCGDGAIRALGDARSSLHWYHCGNCDHLWAAKLAWMTGHPASVSLRRGVSAILSDPWRRLSRGMRRQLPAMAGAAVAGPVGFKVKP
jgi:predicted RNA-binding Zn-ribbon protein involved in translation (DUF1610 family)